MNSSVDLGIQYLGLSLPSPVIASSSDFTASPASIEKLAKAGAGAIVLKSLFEEQIRMEIDSLQMNNMFGTYDYNEAYIAYYTKKNEVSNYLKLISESKKRVSVPVIASIHCSTAEGWTSFAAEVEKAGADALELNVFLMPSDPLQSEAHIRSLYHSVVDGVRAHTRLPLALKLHSHFTDMAAFMAEISRKVDALVLFNRFFSPDIDTENLQITHAGSFSQPSDYYTVLRWIGILSGKVSSCLSASGGIHDGQAVIKSLLSGADAVQIASALYLNGEKSITTMLDELRQWMIRMEFSAIVDFRGKLSRNNIHRPELYERAQFMKYFSDFQYSAGKASGHE